MHLDAFGRVPSHPSTAGRYKLCARCCSVVDARSDDPTFVGKDDDLNTIAQLKLAHEVCQVRPHCRDAQKKGVSDFAVREAPGDEPHNLKLTFRKLG